MVIRFPILINILQTINGVKKDLLVNNSHSINSSLINKMINMLINMQKMLLLNNFQINNQTLMLINNLTHMLINS